MSRRACSKEHAHDRARGRNTEQNSHGSEQPPPLPLKLALYLEQPSSAKRKQKQGVEEKHRAALDPSADGIRAHGVSCETNDRSKREQHALRPRKMRESA